MRKMEVKMFPKPVEIVDSGPLFRIWRIEKNNWNGQQKAEYKVYRLNKQNQSNKRRYVLERRLKRQA
jgi:hypothetical protein